MSEQFRAAERFKAIRTTNPPQWAEVVLAADYDALFRHLERVQDVYDRLRGSLAARGFHRPGNSCEQTTGEPFCSCADYFERNYPKSARFAADRPAEA